MITRRNVMLGMSAVTAAGIAGARYAFAEQAAKGAPGTTAIVSRVDFDVAERTIALPCFSGKSLQLWTFQDATPLPVVRVQVGQPFEARIKNSLTRDGEHMTIHWHGLRIPNVEDGVPYMTQKPIYPGATGQYAFTPPDTGTYFFHTHCNAVEHVGRGLAGVLIVEGDEVHPSDSDIVLVMKDWRLSPDGAFLPFTTDEGAAKAGTSGTVRSINGATKPVISIPASANVRVRLLNVDVTRISEVGIEGAEASIIAVDGNPCPPIPLTSWRLGSASRIDVLLRSPKAGGVVRVVDYFSAEPVVLAELSATGAPQRRERFSVKPLRQLPYARPDLANAERLPFVFSATATGEAVAAISGLGGIEIGSLCLTRRTFWAINKQAWPSTDHKDLGPPLAALKSGKTYIFELQNLTPNAHPIHIHGHTFDVLKSNLRKLPPHRADTVFLIPKERMEVAFVAGLPGRWMFHCHILEHQETGMMGYLEVS